MKIPEVALRMVVTGAIVVVATIPTVDAFAPPVSWGTSSTTAEGCTLAMAESSSSSSSSVASLVENLPDLQELSTAPFMKQVQYGADMTDILTASSSESGNEKLVETIRASLAAQLSHSDGIRGFMVSYLTGSYDSSTDETGGIDAQEMIANEQDPSVLLEAILGLLSKKEPSGADDSSSSSSDDLVSLMCMNVVMPVAMITKHQDPALSEASRLTAARGVRLLGSILPAARESSIRDNLEALREVATRDGKEEASETNDDDPLVTFWTGFFRKWGYEAPQKADIAATVEEILSKSSD